MIGIICEPRSGSTSLYNIFKEYHNLNLIYEPFNSLKKYIPLIVDSPYYSPHNLHKFLEDIKLKYDGFKHLCHHLSFQQNQLIINNFKCIYLYRENLFESILSYCLAGQTGVWDNEQYDGIKKNIPLKMNTYIQTIEQYKKYYHNRKKYKNCLFISYEDVYCRRTGYNSICEYIGMKSLDIVLEKLKYNKYKLKNTFSIPNIDELEKIFYMRINNT